MKRAFWLIILSVTFMTSQAEENSFIGKSDIKLSSDLLTPEALWAMGRIGTYQQAPDGKSAIYDVTYYSVLQNKSHTVLYTVNPKDKSTRLLTTTEKNESSPVYINKGK